MWLIIGPDYTTTHKGLWIAVSCSDAYMWRPWCTWGPVALPTWLGAIEGLKFLLQICAAFIWPSCGLHAAVIRGNKIALGNVLAAPTWVISKLHTSPMYACAMATHQDILVYLNMWICDIWICWYSDQQLWRDKLLRMMHLLIQNVWSNVGFSSIFLIINVSENF